MFFVWTRGTRNNWIQQCGTFILLRRGLDCPIAGHFHTVGVLKKNPDDFRGAEILLLLLDHVLLTRMYNYTDLGRMTVFLLVHGEKQ